MAKRYFIDDKQVKPVFSGDLRAKVVPNPKKKQP